jgi:hypothetical protein
VCVLADDRFIGISGFENFPKALNSGFSTLGMPVELQLAKGGKLSNILGFERAKF